MKPGQTTEFHWLMLAAMACIVLAMLYGIRSLGVQWEASKEAMGRMPRVVDSIKDPCSQCGPTQCRCCRCGK